MRYNGMHYGGMNAGWAIVCFVAVIAIIALVTWAIVASTNKKESSEGRGASHPEAIAMLERHFADGTIDENEYHRRRDVLVQR